MVRLGVEASDRQIEILQLLNHRFKWDLTPRECFPDVPGRFRVVAKPLLGVVRHEHRQIEIGRLGVELSVNKLYGLMSRPDLEESEKPPTGVVVITAIHAQGVNLRITANTVRRDERQDGL
jgi:hypothetical protein